MRPSSRLAAGHSLWAGLFGAFYLWRMGFGRLFLRAFAINLGYLFFFVGVWALTSYVVPLRIQAVILLAMIPILTIAQGATMLRMLGTRTAGAAGWYGRADRAPACPSRPTWP